MLANAIRRKTYDEMDCPLARSLEFVGDWWNILILREAFYGSRRFEEFLVVLGIATSTLTRRLNDMVSSGLLTRHLYSIRPKRHEYMLTELARDFRPIMLAMFAWGNRHFTPEGRRVDMVNLDTGLPFDPVFVDRTTGEPITRVRAVAGPAASAVVRRRLRAIDTLM